MYYSDQVWITTVRYRATTQESRLLRRRTLVDA